MRVIGTVWKLKKNNRKNFGEVLERIMDGFLSTLGTGLSSGDLLHSVSLLLLYIVTGPITILLLMAVLQVTSGVHS